MVGGGDPSGSRSQPPAACFGTPAFAPTGGNNKQANVIITSWRVSSCITLPFTASDHFLDLAVVVVIGQI